MNIIYKKIIYSALIIVLIVSLLSCKKEKENKETSEEPIPQELENIIENSENVIKDIEKIQLASDDPEEFKAEKEKEGDKKEGEEGEGEEEGGGEKEEESSGEGEEEKSSEKEKGKEEESKDKKKEKEKEQMKEEVKKIWTEVEKKIEEIHTVWNNYEPKAIENGASESDVKEFEKYLNALTISVDDKKAVSSYENANELTYNSARFLDFFKGNIDGEMYRIIYFVRKAYIDGKKGDWELAKEDMDKVQPIYEKLILKSKSKDPKDKMLQKLGLSIKDMQEAINEENEKLVKIKIDIILENLKNIKEAEASKADEEE